jgi:NADPH2:quinone reductase
MSGAEAWSLPSFSVMAMGKHGVILNATGMKDWAPQSGAVMVEPSGMVDIYDGVFFQKGDEVNQGQMYSWNEDEFIAACETAAAMTMRGLTSAYLLRRIYPFAKGDTILLHAAAGGVGLIVSQWAKLLGLTVIGTVSSEAKADIARAHGCDHVINYAHEDVAKRVRELTDGVGVNVVFDSVGKATFDASLDSLKRRGLMVCVGTASGPIPPFNPQVLAMKGSLYMTRPALADYIADPAEKAALAGELFDHVAAGRIQIEIHQRYALEEAVQAHRDLEARKTTGSSVFVI